jgi:hypothetical protein
MTTKKVSKADKAELARIEKAVIVLKEGAAKLSNIVETAARDAGSVTKGMVAEWKPLLSFTPAGTVIENGVFENMRKVFKTAAYAGQDDNPLFVVEYRKVDHGSGVKVWTERGDIPEKTPEDTAAIDKLEAFTYKPTMRAHDTKKLAPDLNSRKQDGECAASLDDVRAAAGALFKKLGY